MSDDWRADVARAIADRAAVDWDRARAEARLHRRTRRSSTSCGFSSRWRAFTAAPPTDATERVASPSLDVLPAEWGPLTVLEHIGRGTFGDVYRAHDPRLDRTVALKILRRQQPAEATAVIAEARLLARVSHPNVVTVYGAERIGGQVGVWMSLIDGPTLEDELVPKGPFDPSDCREHRSGLVRRARRRASRRRRAPRCEGGRTSCAPPMVASCSRISAPGATRRNSVRPRPATSPARRSIWRRKCSRSIRHRRRATSTASAWCCSICSPDRSRSSAARSTTCARPTPPASAAAVRELRPDVPARLSRIVDRCLAPNPADRFQDVAAVAQALQGASGRAWTARRALTTAAVVLTVVAVSFALWRYGRSHAGAACRPGVHVCRYSVAAEDPESGLHECLGGWPLPRRRCLRPGPGFRRAAAVAPGRAKPAGWDSVRGNFAGRDTGCLRVVRRVPAVRAASQAAELRKHRGIAPAVCVIQIPTFGCGRRIGRPMDNRILVERSRADGTGEIGLVAVQDGSFRVLTPIDWRGSTAFFSPDGRAFAFDVPASDTESQRDIFVMALDGGERIPAVVSAANDVLMGWSPDGSHLLFASNRSGTTDLWAAPVSSRWAAWHPGAVESWYRQRPIRRHDEGRLAVFQDASERSRHRARLASI